MNHSLDLLSPCIFLALPFVASRAARPFLNDWAKILDNKGQVDTFILDFEKAFDTPQHELLKSKLFILFFVLILV